MENVLLWKGQTLPGNSCRSLEYPQSQGRRFSASFTCFSPCSRAQNTLRTSYLLPLSSIPASVFRGLRDGRVQKTDRLSLCTYFPPTSSAHKHSNKGQAHSKSEGRGPAWSVGASAPTPDTLSMNVSEIQLSNTFMLLFYMKRTRIFHKTHNGMEKTDLDNGKPEQGSQCENCPQHGTQLSENHSYPFPQSQTRNSKGSKPKIIYDYESPLKTVRCYTNAQSFLLSY